MLPRTLGRADIAGEAIFTGGLSMVAVRRDIVAALLPPGVTLSEDDESGVYRCLIAFGEQSDGVTFFAGFPVPWSVRYREAFVGVPFVRRGTDGPYLFVRGMPCDFWPAVWNGNMYYGFMKQFSRIEWDGDRFVSRSDAAEPDFHAILEPCAPSTGVEAAAWIRQAAALPVMGRRTDGTIVTSRFEWDFSDAAVDPAHVRLHASARFPELTATDVPQCHPGCRVRGMRWRLSWPEPHRTGAAPM
jgi:hypothetical protein